METKRTTSKTGFFIEVTCPGCGGALELDEDFFVLGCSHCGSVHRVKMPDIPAAYLIPSKVGRREAQFSIDRYLKKQNLPLSNSGMHLKQLYYPYWKIDAVLFRVRNKTHRRVISEESEYSDEIVVTRDQTDISLSPYTTTRAAGMPFEGIPASIGLRTEYIRMLPFSQENVEDDFDSYPILTSWEDVRVGLLQNVGFIAELQDADFGNNVTELFHPRAALVYFPFLVFESYSRQGFSRYVIDGVSGRVLDHVTDIDNEAGFEYPEAPDIEFGALTVEHHRCNTCGVDLPPEQSYVYICRNCHELTVLGAHGASIQQIFYAPIREKPQDKMFPFWSMKIGTEDAGRLRTLFGGIYNSDQLVIPAFKAKNFEAVARLTKRMSSAIVQMELTELESPDNRFQPISVSLDDALLLAELIIYRQRFSRSMQKGTNDPVFVPEETRLVYLPFHPEHYFYVDSVLNTVTFEKSLAP